MPANRDALVEALGKKRLDEILNDEEYQKWRDRIANEVPFVDIKPYSHNLISISLGGVARQFGPEVANDLIEEFELEELGWTKQHVDK